MAADILPLQVSFKIISSMVTYITVISFPRAQEVREGMGHEKKLQKKMRGVGV